MFLLGNKQELNKLCTALVNFEVTVEDVLQSQENRDTEITPDDAENKTFSAVAKDKKV